MDAAPPHYRPRSPLAADSGFTARTFPLALRFPALALPLSLLLLALLLGAFFVPRPAAAQTPPPFSEAEAQSIDQMLMCPVCPAETIDQAQVEISFQMRAVVRQLLAEGQSRDAILAFFVERYGPDILAAPPKSGVNLVAWILPAVGVLAGVGGLYFIIRAMTRRPPPGGQPIPATAGAAPGAFPPAADTAPPADLQPYLPMVDRQLAARQIIPPPPAAAGPPSPESRPYPATPGVPAAAATTESGIAPESASYAAMESAATPGATANPPDDEAARYG